MKRLREILVIAFAYGALTVCYTWPTARLAAKAFIGDGKDGFQNVWNMWWVRHCLLELRNPYFTDLLHHPHGISLVFQSLNPFNGLISVPLQSLFPMELTYNLVVLFSFVMSGVGMYLLAKDLTGNRDGAFVAGMIYAFSPYHMGHTLGHLQLIAMEWVPFYLLFLVRILKGGGRRNTLLAAGCLVLSALCSWYYLVYSLLLTALLMLKAALRRGTGLRDGTLWRAALAVLLGMLVLSPLIGRMIGAKLSTAFLGAHDPETYMADLTGFFVPGAISTWGALWCRGIWKTWMGNASEHSAFLGYSVVALGIYACVRVRASRFWGVVAIIGAVLALGPHLTVLGRSLAVPLPYLVLHRWVPFFSFTGMPARFAFVTVIGTAVMAAYGMQAIEARLQRGRRVLGAAIPMLLVGLEFLTVPYPVTSIRVPDFYHRMAADGESYAIIDAPMIEWILYYQTVHGKPMIGGYVTRPPAENYRFLTEMPVVATLALNAPAAGPEATRGALDMLRGWNVRYIITHGEGHAEYVESHLKLPQVYDDDLIKVYELAPR